MTNIPTDIMKAAEDALDNLLCNCRESLGSHAAVRQASIEEIAKEILSERRRCALIARQWETSSFQDEHYAANSIADKIMAGEA